MSNHRIQIRFFKQGDLRMISHRDLVRTMERLFRRADLDLAMSEGFHPRPKMSFPSALAVGIAAVDEVMELELNQPVDKDELLERLRQQEVPGLEFQSVRVLNSTERKRQLETATYEFAVPVERRDQTVVKIEEFLARPQCLVNRPKRSAPVDIRAGVPHL
ncbi:MAG: TIGR03936 family radical SAM-associated protein, partial [Planctomycetota bacterium]|nr:TIGR03936 family radical SAM-associated protein [Planctomycetota bacterium]